MTGNQAIFSPLGIALAAGETGRVRSDVMYDSLGHYAPTKADEAGVLYPFSDLLSHRLHNLDFTNLTSVAGSTTYGIIINDLATQTTSTEYAIYQEGTNWDYGLYIEDAGYFNTTLTVIGALASATLDTGQGAYELYAMDQDVLIASSPEF